MKNKIYISGPITGIDNYIENFHQASKELAAAGYIPIDPCTLPHDHNKSYGAYMKEDIRELLECDYIYMLDKWETSKGAVIEHAVALSCGIKILVNIEEDDRILTEEQTLNKPCIIPKCDIVLNI